MKPLDILLILVSLLFATGVIVDSAWGPERREHRSVIRLQQKRLEMASDSLKVFAKKTGGYPTTEEGLDIVPGLRKKLLKDEFKHASDVVSQKSGIRTIYGIPFLYENRQGQEGDLFSSSPADEDRKKKRRYSRKVDKGVFISSLGLRSDVGRVFGEAWLDALLVFSGGIMAFAVLAYIITRNRRAGDRVRGVNAIILVGIAVLLLITVAISKGTGGSTLEEKLPDQVGAYRVDLLEEYLATLHGFAEQGVYDPADLSLLEEKLQAEFKASDMLPQDARESPEEATNSR